MVEVIGPFAPRASRRLNAIFIPSKTEEGW